MLPYSGSPATRPDFEMFFKRIGIGIPVEIALDARMDVVDIVVLGRIVERETNATNRKLAMGHLAAAFDLHAYLASGQPSSRPSLSIP